MVGQKAILVTPGGALRRRCNGRPRSALQTPAEAIRDGADYLVMGRQITRAVTGR